MADATNTTSPSAQPALGIRPARRRILGLTTAAAAMLAAGPAAAMTTVDPLEALWLEYEHAMQRFLEICRAEDAASNEARAHHPPRPASLYKRNYDSGEISEVDEETLVRWRDEKRLATMKIWQTECDAVDRAHGVDVLDERAGALACAADELADRIIATVATTPSGALVKLKLAVKLGQYDAEDDIVGQLIFGLIADLTSMGGRS